MGTTKHNYVGLQLLRHLVGEKGLNIFTLEHAQEAAKKLHIRASYVTELLHYLHKEGWIRRLKTGLYAVKSESGLGTTPHEYEIATALVSPCAISHWTAMHYHHLTQQIPNKVFALTPTGTAIPRSVDKKHYQYVQVKPDRYFGFQKVWVEQSQILITDVERTLLDGLMAPQHCGDFQEVLYAFKLAKGNINLEKLIHYALKLDIAVMKRLGWILEHQNYSNSYLAKLLSVPIKGYRKLDPSRPASGPYDKKWMIRENLGG